MTAAPSSPSVACQYCGKASAPRSLLCPEHSALIEANDTSFKIKLAIRKHDYCRARALILHPEDGIGASYYAQQQREFEMREVVKLLKERAPNLEEALRFAESQLESERYYGD